MTTKTLLETATNSFEKEYLSLDIDILEKQIAINNFTIGFNHSKELYKSLILENLENKIKKFKELSDPKIPNNDKIIYYIEQLEEIIQTINSIILRDI